MRIFLTGASGYIGSAVLDAFVRSGHEVTGLVRNPEKAADVASRGGTPLRGDLNDPASYRRAAEGHDVIVHAGFDNARGAETDRVALETLIAAARADEATRPRLLIYTSGIWVLGSTATPAAEDAPLNPVAIVAFRPAHEQMVLSAGGAGLRTAVIRPGIVFGGSRGIVGDIFRDAVNGLIRVIGTGDNRWPTVYDRDLADLYVQLALARRRVGRLPRDRRKRRTRQRHRRGHRGACAEDTGGSPGADRGSAGEAGQRTRSRWRSTRWFAARGPARSAGRRRCARSRGNAARLFDEWRAGRRRAAPTTDSSKRHARPALSRRDSRGGAPGSPASPVSPRCSRSAT